MIKSVYVRNNLSKIKDKLRGCDNDVRIYVEYLEINKENASTLADRVQQLLREKRKSNSLQETLLNDIAELTLENESLKRQLEGKVPEDDIPF